jgi:hypothetical protein
MAPGRKRLSLDEVEDEVRSFDACEEDGEPEDELEGALDATVWVAMESA